MSKPKSVHGARTIMFTELEKVMEFSFENGQYIEAMGDNVFAKKSSNGIKQTKGYLKRLYGFNINNPSFVAFKYFWGISETNEKPLLALIYAIKNDEHLRQSIISIRETKLNTKVTTEQLEEVIEGFHPNHYSVNTRRSMVRNITSSWKQAGFILGKIKNLRSQPSISYKVVAFAMLLAYLDGERGDFILQDACVNALCLSENNLRELVVEASKRDFLQYQFAGNVTSISFDNLIKNIGIDAI